MAVLNTVLYIEENSKTAFIQVASGKDGGELALSPRPLRQRSAMRKTGKPKRREIRGRATMTETELGGCYRWVVGRRITDAMTGTRRRSTPKPKPPCHWCGKPGRHGQHEDIRSCFRVKCAGLYWDASDRRMAHRPGGEPPLSLYVSDPLLGLESLKRRDAFLISQGAWRGRKPTYWQDRAQRKAARRARGGP